MAEPAISLIIPCYNTPAEQLSRALESVAAQHFSDYEIILVDDGSAPEFHAVCQAQSETDACIRLVTTVNQGVAAARNTGMSAASGRYIAFLDADDAISPSFFREAYAAAAETGADLVMGGVRLTDSLPEQLPDDSEDIPERDVYRGEAVQGLKKYFVCRHWELRFPAFNVPRGPIARLVRRELALAHPFPVGMTVGEDSVWSLEVLACSETVCVVRSLWYWYWQNPVSAVHRYHPDMREQWERQLALMRPFLDLDDPEQYQAFVMHVHDGVFYLWRCYFRYAGEHPEQKAEMRRVRRAVCTEHPWRLLAEPRFFRLAPRKYKIISVLYRMHLLLPVMRFWQRLKGKQ